MSILKLPLALIKKIGFSLGSSSYLAKSLVHASGIRWKWGIKIFELGSGNGIVTKEIITALGKDAYFYALECEDKYIESLRKFSNGRFEIIHDSASELGKYAEDETVDVIISTLPLWSLPHELVEKILIAAKKALRPWGRFIQYQYWMVNRKDVARHFHFESIRFEPRNFTPACIYITKKN